MGTLESIKADTSFFFSASFVLLLNCEEMLQCLDTFVCVLDTCENHMTSIRVLEQNRMLSHKNECSVHFFVTCLTLLFFF